MSVSLLIGMVGITAFVLGAVLSWFWMAKRESNILSRLREKQYSYDELSLKYDDYRRKYIDLDDQYDELKNLEHTYRVAYEDWKTRYENLERLMNSGEVSSSVIQEISPIDSKMIVENTKHQDSSIFNLTESEIYSKYDALLSQEIVLNNTIIKIKDESEDLRELVKAYKVKSKKYKKSSTKYKVALLSLTEDMKNIQNKVRSKDVTELKSEIEKPTTKNTTT